jgi:hypothetical protein
MLRWVTMEGKIGTGVCDVCRLVSETLNVGDVAQLNQLLGAELIFHRVMLRWFSCTVFLGKGGVLAWMVRLALCSG